MYFASKTFLSHFYNLLLRTEMHKCCTKLVHTYLILKFLSSCIHGSRMILGSGLLRMGCGSGPVPLRIRRDPEDNFLPVLRIRGVYPGSRIRINEFKHFNQKIVSKLSEISSGLFITDPGPDFLPIPDPGSREQKGPGSGSATLLFTPI
jgi:hypothetical protein